MRAKLLFLFFAGISGFSFAQYTTYSPYSSYGIGERGNLDHAAFTGIGNSAITYFDSTILNFYNPATYNTLGKGQPLYSLGLTSRMSFYKQGATNQLKTAAFYEHFAMAFTLKKHLGLAFGLKPYTRKGYEIYDRVSVGSDSLKYSYLGSGSINQLFLGLSTNLIKMNNTTLSVGANLSYLFGVTSDEKRSQVISTVMTEIGGIGLSKQQINSFQYELGAYFKQRIKENHIITLATTLEPSQSLRAKRDDYVFYGAFDTPTSYDTISEIANQRGTIKIASSMNLGFNYTFQFNDNRKNNSHRLSELAFHVNYATTDWSKFSSTFETYNNLSATSKLSLGVQYVPERSFIDNSTQSKFLERVRYRVGYYQYTLPYTIGGEQVHDKGYTLGFGIPLVSQRSLSSVNFGFSYGTRDSALSNSLQEKYVGINFGISIAPALLDRWFKKRKLD